MTVEAFSLTACVCDFSSKVEMGKWIEDLNIAIDMARTSQEKSSILLPAGLGDHSNREFLTWCDITMLMAPKFILPHS